ncbi:hypothetical protein MRB53_017002 [Persea americana]|uniref:Uncharacterized protein n=1 Tax=Persea americana TaxID=3435 RepID=A0ACC2M4F6_PERAE|nr:hypothetical protein MRB53_017002 [Persea americana]|eukprot:TRINITY_DN80978_c0_g1_i1.p1 TRINITY_DN80978_c0_g1~~TRINITY_DN80978_c0_g1_i1.p1  ORF type:complete len:185 (-),score=55.71 TRINITY_DN80978_c0_g1_i1:262-816(-)
MAATLALPSLSCICRSSFHGKSTPSSSATPPFLYLPCNGRRRSTTAITYSLSLGGRKKYPEMRRIRAVSEETLVPEGQEDEAPPSEQPVSVPVSPSDMLTMFFKAEGTMDESAVSTVMKTLEEQEGISDLTVQVLEGIASVELTKQTTVQATGVASNLVEIIQGAGFKLQALNLSFEDEEDMKN